MKGIGFFWTWRYSFVNLLFACLLAISWSICLGMFVLYDLKYAARSQELLPTSVQFGAISLKRRNGKSYFTFAKNFLWKGTLSINALPYACLPNNSTCTVSLTNSNSSCTNSNSTYNTNPSCTDFPNLKREFSIIYQQTRILLQCF